VTIEDPSRCANLFVPNKSSQANSDPTIEQQLRDIDGLEELQQNTNDGESSLEDSSSY
jgi:hypothetical protein